MRTHAIRAKPHEPIIPQRLIRAFVRGSGLASGRDLGLAPRRSCLRPAWEGAPPRGAPPRGAPPREAPPRESPQLAASCGTSRCGWTRLVPTPTPHAVAALHAWPCDFLRSRRVDAALTGPFLHPPASPLAGLRCRRCASWASTTPTATTSSTSEMVSPGAPAGAQKRRPSGVGFREGEGSGAVTAWIFSCPLLPFVSHPPGANLCCALVPRAPAPHRSSSGVL